MKAPSSKAQKITKKGGLDTLLMDIKKYALAVFRELSSLEAYWLNIISFWV